MLDLFAQEAPWQETLADGAVVLRRFALEDAPQLITQIKQVSALSPFRQMVTPGGYTMSVAMTNCGDYGWTTHPQGYRYVTHDPLTGKPWPRMPGIFCAFSERASAMAGYAGFSLDACLINRYVTGAKMSLHQDRDEHNLDAPIVSVSLGLPAVFQFGGRERRDPVKRLLLEHGDVVVWGGASRLFYHGIQPLKSGQHPLTGSYRYNLTFRAAGRGD